MGLLQTVRFALQRVRGRACGAMYRTLIKSTTSHHCRRAASSAWSWATRGCICGCA